LNTVVKNILVVFFALISLISCKTTRMEYSSDKFVVIEATVSDSFKSLAEKYLKDEKNDWLISEFNGIQELRPGDNIVIPLTYFNIGGFKPTGYQVVPVLNYEPVEIQAQGSRQYFSDTQIRAQFQFLKENNFRVISVNELLQFIEYNTQIPEKSIVLTFTGEPKSFYETIYPVIDSFGYNVTLFIDPDRIGGDGMASWDMLNELSGKGVSIQSCGGSSGLSVSGFSRTLKAYFFFIEKKIRNSKKLIEKKLGRDCIFYSYPGGKSNNLIIGLLDKYNFKGAFINSGESNPFFVDKFELNRINIYQTTAIDEYKTKIKTFQTLDIN